MLYDLSDKSTLFSLGKTSIISSIVNKSSLKILLLSSSPKRTVATAAACLSLSSVVLLTSFKISLYLLMISSFGGKLSIKSLDACP